MSKSNRASANSVKMAKFEIPWKITEEQFDAIPKTKLTKYFITAHQNAACHWRVELTAGTENGKMSFNVHYDSGPLRSIKTNYELWVQDSDDAYKKLISVENGEFDEISSQNNANFDVTGKDEFRRKHSCKCFPFVFSVVLKIPIPLFLQAAAKYNYDEGAENNDGEMPPRWLKEQFNFITNRDRVKYSDVTLVSANDEKFYCHRLVLGTQSAALEAMFRNELTEEEKKGIFRFPMMSGRALHFALEIFYMGHKPWFPLGLKLSDVMELADFAEQYGLIVLKLKCISILWSRIIRQPNECVELIRFADLHDDMKYLKDRCFDVLVDHYEELSSAEKDIFMKFKKGKFGDEGGDNRNDRLRTEFILYMYRRVSFV